MISSAQKTPVLRYLLIIVPFLTLLTCAGYLYLHYQKAEKLRISVEKLISARQNSALIDSCIINLYSADNNSRLYTLSGNKIYLKKFTADINKITGVINQIKFEQRTFNDTTSLKFSELMKQKTLRTGNYIHLRLLTDSLIKSSSIINNKLLKFSHAALNAPVVKFEHRITVDTIQNTDKSKPRKKFFGRLIAAFSPRKSEDKNNTVVVKKDTVITTVESGPAVAKASGKHALKNYYKNLNAVNNKLISNEKQILLINNNLIEEIIASLKLYKTVEDSYVNSSKRQLSENMSNVFYEFKKTSVLNGAFLLALIVMVFYNIWKIFRNERKVMDYSERAEEYAESKGRFLAGMSHEIRTPLNSVIGFSEQLGQQELTTEQREQVNAISRSSEMLLDLVNEILDFSKYETGKMNFDNAPFMLAQNIEEIFNAMNVQATKKHILLENKIAIDETLCCEGDKMRLKQVIMNLLGNAIKFTPKGKVTLIANVDGGTGGNQILKVTIKDTGLGINKIDLAQIFEEFSQVASAQKSTRHKGTGLGLAICKKIVELQGGTITVKSEPGVGSEFSFELPVKKCEQKEELSAYEMNMELTADIVKGKHVLFAEDNQLNVLLATTILKKWNITYDVAYNGYEGLLLFNKNNYDVVLTDIQMPEMNGLELTHFIREHDDPYKSTVPVLALTANVLKEDRDNYIQSGVTDVVLKPFREKNLISKVALAIQNNVSLLKFVE